VLPAILAEKSDNSLNSQEELEKSVRKPDVQPIDFLGENETAGTADCATLSLYRQFRRRPFV
jgi:hypothetical protein